MPSRRAVLATAAVVAVAIGLTPTSRRLQEYLGPAYGGFSYGTGGYGGALAGSGGYGGSGDEGE